MLSNGLKRLSTFHRPLPVKLLPTLPPNQIIPEPNVIPPSTIFDPDNWPLLAWKINDDEKNFDDEESEKSGKTEEKDTDNKKHKKERNEVAEENRSDGHAPIKTALSALMQGLQQSSSMSTSLSDVDVTLFNFHSTKFAERLLNRNVSSVVIVESSHTFAKNAKKFASQYRNVDAYRADISTLMGVGRKKTTKFPKKLLFAGKTNDWDNIVPLELTTNQEHNVDHKQHIRVRKPHFLAVLPTATAQRTIVNSMIQHALLHHSKTDPETVFAFGEANLLTFLNCGVLSQFLCSSDHRLHFLSHQHRRHSAVFHMLFDLRLLHTREPDHGSSNKCEHIHPIPIGHSSRSFHPDLPTPLKITHEKKLAEVNLFNGEQYAVRISPKRHIAIDGKPLEEPCFILSFAHFMDVIGKQPNAKQAETVVRSIWPESGISIPKDIITDKIGMTSEEQLEKIYLIVREELEETAAFKTFKNDLKIKRII